MKMTYKKASRLLGGDLILDELIKNGQIKIASVGKKGTKMFNASEVYRVSRELRKPKEL